jgi:hypothetical protein
LRDWCRFTGAGSSYIEPGSPWQNPYVESFGSRLRDQLLAVEAFSSLLEAQVLVEDWRIEYYTLRPHSALGYLTPTDYAKAWTAAQRRYRPVEPARLRDVPPARTGEGGSGGTKDPINQGRLAVPLRSQATETDFSGDHGRNHWPDLRSQGVEVGQGVQPPAPPAE